MEAIAIPQGFRITTEQFDQLASAEQLARLELTKDGELIVMSPTGGEAGRKNFNLYLDLGNWNRQTKLGEAFDSSTIFVFPNGARRSPDVSWIISERWNRLTLKEKQGFPPIAPDFVIELVSPSERCDPADFQSARERAPRERNQRYEDLQTKMTSDPAPPIGVYPRMGARDRARMKEYLENGVKLGWLIEPSAKTVEIYRVGQQVEILNNPQTLSGEDVLPELVLDLSEIFG